MPTGAVFRSSFEVGTFKASDRSRDRLLVRKCSHAAWGRPLFQFFNVNEFIRKGRGFIL